ncbi:MAG: hypothetical protein GC178_12225 [Flavobacteriales bacterium]|nr:hypothetical protein [Flavobacteriales bacterium]
MSDPRPQALYNCSQSELYAICSIGWTSYNENQADFEAFKTIYTATYGTDAMAEVEAAANLPGFQERNEAAETAYIQMVSAHAECLTKWKTLRSYIKSSFPPALQKPKIESAGYDHYTKAANRNWDQTFALLTAGQHFIDNNTADLTAGGMPATFAADYALAKDNFGTLYGQFTDFEQDEEEATDTKVMANNAIYRKLSAMFEDAQIIYEHNAAKRNRFVFAQVKAMITTKPGPDTVPSDSIIIFGKVLDAATSTALANASVNTTPDGSTQTFSAVTGEDGKYEMTVSGLQTTSAGTLMINAEALDHEPKSQPLNYETGNRYELSFELLEFTPPPEPAP